MKPGPANLDLGQVRGGGQRGADALSQVARFAAGGLGQAQGDAAGKVTVGAIAGALQGNDKRVDRGQQPLLVQLPEGLGHEGVQVRFQGSDSRTVMRWRRGRPRAS